MESRTPTPTPLLSRYPKAFRVLASLVLANRPGVKDVPALLALLTAAFCAFDDWATWVCLRDPALGNGKTLYEANPFALWIFDFIGLEAGLILTYIVTLGCLALIVKAPVLKSWQKNVILGSLCVLAGWAGWNNLGHILEFGLLAS